MKLSQHFSVAEFDCKDGTPVPERDYTGLQYLCRVYLEPLRTKFGPVTIHSGYRTRSHNTQIGGAPNSFHIYDIHDGNDQAADIVCAKGTPNEWHAMLNRIRRERRNNRGGLGLYRTFCHVDLRDYKADWRG